MSHRLQDCDEMQQSDIQQGGVQVVDFAVVDKQHCDGLSCVNAPGVIGRHEWAPGQAHINGGRS